MMIKVCAAGHAIALVLAMTVSSGRADGLEEREHVIVHKRHHVVRTLGPRSEYARVAVKALFDSCWRYRQVLTPRGRDLERIWTCDNYIKPNAEFDWGYGSSIADLARAYGYPW